jgi:hypothetical protein
MSTQILMRSSIKLGKCRGQGLIVTENKNKPDTTTLCGVSFRQESYKYITNSYFKSFYRVRMADSKCRSTLNGRTKSWVQ